MNLVVRAYKHMRKLVMILFDPFQKVVTPHKRMLVQLSAVIYHLNLLLESFELARRRAAIKAIFRLLKTQEIVGKGIFGGIFIWNVYAYPLRFY